jgi:hypothetical protein
VRIDKNELLKKIVWTNSGGYRGRGRPKSRWIDGVEEDITKLGCRNWRADAQDRGHWRHLLEEAKAHPRAVESKMMMMMMMYICIL